MKLAILQVADTSPLESLVVMLNHAGYECRICSESLRGRLIEAGCDTVVSLRGLVENWGYEYPSLKIEEASIEMMDKCDLYVDVKAHRNAPKVLAKWPHLKGKILWYRINGSKPEHVIRTRNGVTEDCGDECDPPCPVVTPNMWYAQDKIDTTTESNKTWRTYEPAPWVGKAYAMWPPFYEIDRYKTPRKNSDYTDPICLVHNLNGWGYAALTKSMREMGVKLYGRGTADGLIPHSSIPGMLSSALAMVHLKSSDAPGYALYEALAAKCPVIVTRRLIWRNAMQDMFIPGETCLVFDRETHDPLSDKDVQECTEEVRGHLTRLQDPKYNNQIGMAGYQRLKELMWNTERDGEGFKAFMERHYGR